MLFKKNHLTFLKFFIKLLTVRIILTSVQCTLKTFNIQHEQYIWENQDPIWAFNNQGCLRTRVNLETGEYFPWGSLNNYRHVLWSSI